MSSKKTRKTVPTTSTFNLREAGLDSTKKVLEQSILKINKHVNSTFIIKTFVNKSYITGLTDTNNDNTETEQFVNLQKAEIQLVTIVMIYLAHVLISFYRLNTFLSEPFDYSDEELEYIVDKLDNWIVTTNIYFFNSLPKDMNPEGFRNITNVLEAKFNVDNFGIQNVTEQEKAALRIYNEHPMISILESLSEQYALKRLDLMDKIEKEQKEKELQKWAEDIKKEEAEQRAAKAEAELLALLKGSKKTRKNKEKQKPPTRVEKPSISVEKPSISVEKPLTEKELKKIEADEKNRQKQLLEKQLKLEKEKQRNEELQKKFNELLLQPVEKPLSPPPAEKSLSPPVEKSLSPPAGKPLSPPPAEKSLSPPPVLPTLTKPLEQYFDKTQFETLKRIVRSTDASNEIKTEFPNMEFSNTADETYKYIVRSTIYVLSEITKATGFPFFCLKGGKVLQLTTLTPYISDDIDILVLNGSHKTALEIAKIIKQMFLGYPISVLDKSQITSSNTVNQNIIKMSYGTRSLKAFLDIDFSPTPAYATMFFSNLKPINFGSLLFFAQSPLQFLDEKIFFYELYKIKCTETTDQNRQNVCKYQLAKFQKVLAPLIPNNEFYLERLNYIKNAIIAALPEFSIA